MEERLPQVTRFPQRAKSASPAEPEVVTGKKQHVKRPSLELVDSHSFVTDEKDKGSKSGPRIIETELSKSEVFEAVSRSSVEYAQSTTETSLVDDEEDTTPLMEKLAIDLYAILANENAKEDDKKSKFEEATTISSDDDTTTFASEVETEKAIVSSTTPSTTTTTTTTTTPAPTTTTTEAPRGRGALTAGRTNRFKFQPKGPAASTEAPAEPSTDSSKPKNRFNRPSSSSSFSGRNGASRATKTTSAPEEVKENVEKSEAPAPSKLGSSKSRNRFSLRNQAGTTTEKSAEAESTTVSRLLKPRPQFSLRNRSRNGPAAASTTESNDVTEAAEDNKEEKPAEKASSIVPRPTSRLNINRPANRAAPGQKARTSPLQSRRVTSNDENNDGHKSANENESDLETTTQNNLNKLKSRPRIQINADSKAKKTASSPVVVNRKVNPLISKRKFGVTSTTGTIIR